jgi:uncharacterized protein (DUF1015 family)
VLHPATLYDVPRFEPFPALRYLTSSSVDITAVTSPPYDVFDESVRATYAKHHPHNIVALDYPIESDGPGRYQECATTLADWVSSGVLITDDQPSFSIYRMTFTDEAGDSRTTIGVVGALEVVDEGSGGVLPHERTTPKAKTDRLDLTRATQTNLSPVWGLSLSSGLTDLLRDPAETIATCTDEDGVFHHIERVTDPLRVAAISECVSAQPVLIADGHHRYAISRTYRDEQRQKGTGGRHNGAADAELTMTYVGELIDEQLSVAAIHRLYNNISADELVNALSLHYDTSDAGQVSPRTISHMSTHGVLCVVFPDGTGVYLHPKEDTFTGVRALDSARLEHALANTPHDVSYQHGVTDVITRLTTSDAECAILIRPVSLEEIRRTAHTGELMPPKSTFFTPKLRTGLVMRQMRA